MESDGEVYDENRSGDVSNIVRINYFAYTADWDGDQLDDGIELEIYFFDEQGSVISFEDTEYTVVVSIFSTKLIDDTTAPAGKRLQKIKVIYENQFKAKSSNTKFKIRFEESAIALNMAIVEILVNIPGIGMFPGPTDPPMIVEIP